MDNKFILSQSFNEVIFEKRHKKYGAYEIRRRYTRRALVAVGAAILFFTSASLTWAFCLHHEKPVMYRSTPVDLSDDIRTVDPNKEKEKIEPLKEVKSTSNSVADKGPKTKDITTKIDVTLEPVEPPPGNLEVGKDPKGVIGGIGGGPQNPDPCFNCPPIDSTPPPVRIIEWSENPPTCDALDPYLVKTMRYPNICRDRGIEGVVYMQFIVDTKGNYRDVKVIKGAHPALDAEALRVMENMPKWTPAKDDNGELVEFIMRKPIRFELAN